MKICANCSSLAVYNYIGTPYCEEHLPRFLRKKEVTIGAVRIPVNFDSPSEDLPPIAAPSSSEEVVEEKETKTATKKQGKVVASEEVVEEAPKGE
jgi:hypothetical protein